MVLDLCRSFTMRDVRVVIGASAGFLRGYRLVSLLLAGVFLALSGSDSIQAQVVQNPRRGAGEEMDIRNGAFSPSPRTSTTSLKGSKAH